MANNRLSNAWKALKGEKLSQKRTIIVNPTQIDSGRSSQSSHDNIFDVGTPDKLIDPKYPYGLIETIEALCVTNQDLSQGVSNIVSLANTEVTIKINGATDKEIENMQTHFKLKTKQWWNKGSGLSGLTRALMAQAMRTGAVSAEMVIASDLSGISSIVIVPTSSIRFIYNKETLEYNPVQVTSNIKNMTGVATDHVELNPFTYKYFGMSFIEDSPYATPPFIAALRHVMTQKDMVENINYIVEKAGLLGYLQVLMEAPEEDEGETEAAYRERLLSYLKESSTQIQQNLRKGVLVGYNTHEVDFKETTGKASDAAKIFQVNEELLMSGMNQDPAMFGRSYSTTETYAGIVMRKLMEQIQQVQDLASQFISETLRIEAILAGFRFESIEVQFGEPDIKDKKVEQEIITLKTANLVEHWRLGLIDQQEVANQLGYEKPVLEMETPPSSSPLPTPGEDNNDEGDEEIKDNNKLDKKSKDKAKEDKTKKNQLINELINTLEKEYEDGFE